MAVYSPERIEATRVARYGPASREERFWAKVDQSGGPGACWPFTGYLLRGYGQYTAAGHRTLPAHRHAFELARGPIPEGMTLDHLCRNKVCANPAHLEPVTLQENLRREAADVVATRPTCRRGHALTPENLWRSPTGTKRQCRACMRIRGARRVARRHSHEEE